MYGMTNVFFQNLFFYNFNLKKKKILNFGKILKCPWDSGDDDGDGDCNRHGEFWSPPVKCGPLHIYMDSQKIGGKKVNVKLFTVDPYVGVIFFTGLWESAKNGTYCEIWPPGGAIWWTKSSDMQVHWIKTIWAKGGGVSPSWGPTIIISEKNQII